MRAGGGKGKGGEFERTICKALSKWITNGQREDVFWRSAMSGGRATVSKGKVRQAGDICAVAEEGHPLTNVFYFECKHLKDITLDSLVKNNGTLLKVWQIAVKDAAKYSRTPCLIFRQNHWPTIFATTEGGTWLLKLEKSVFVRAREYDLCFIRFDDLLKSEYPL